LRHSLSTALPRIFNSVDLASQSSRRSRVSLTTFLFYHVCLHSSRFCGRFFPFLQIFFMPPGCCCFVLARFLPPRPPCQKKHPAQRCLREPPQKKGISGIFPCFTQEMHPFTQKSLAFTPPPRAIFSLASNLCFLVPQSMLWYELEGTVAHRPVRFQYIIEYM
jgi:hypothetical protein